MLINLLKSILIWLRTEVLMQPKGSDWDMITLTVPRGDLQHYAVDTSQMYNPPKLLCPECRYSMYQRRIRNPYVTRISHSSQTLKIRVCWKGPSEFWEGVDVTILQYWRSKYNKLNCEMELLLKTPICSGQLQQISIHVHTCVLDILRRPK